MDPMKGMTRPQKMRPSSHPLSLHVFIPVVESMEQVDWKQNASMAQRRKRLLGLSVALLVWVGQIDVPVVVGEDSCRNNDETQHWGVTTSRNTHQDNVWSLNLENEDDMLFGFQPWHMRPVTIVFNDNLSLEVFETHSSFCSSGADDTGLVVWGASVALSQYLIAHPETVYGKRVLELGCGSALPSMISHLLGAVENVATDFRIQTLWQVLFQSKMNDCSLHVELLDWENPSTMADLQPDLVLAADVVYGLSHVDPLVKTIEQVLPRNASLLIATRDGRLGIPEFRRMMSRNFEERILVSSVESKDLPPLPSSISDDPLARDRWSGTFSIYIYRWKSSSR